MVSEVVGEDLRIVSAGGVIIFSKRGNMCRFDHQNRKDKHHEYSKGGISVEET
jgi:hypothetical protein